MKYIYIVQGFCGAYSDFQEWPVCAYDSEKEAKAHAERASAFHRANPKLNTNPHDPYFVTQYMEHTYYHVVELLLWEAGDTVNMKKAGER